MVCGELKNIGESTNNFLAVCQLRFCDDTKNGKILLACRGHPDYEQSKGFTMRHCPVNGKGIVPPGLASSGE